MGHWLPRQPTAVPSPALLTLVLLLKNTVAASGPTGGVVLCAFSPSPFQASSSGCLYKEMSPTPGSCHKLQTSLFARYFIVGHRADWTVRAMKTARLAFALTVALLILALLTERSSAQNSIGTVAMGFIQSLFTGQLGIAGLLLRLLTSGASTAFGWIGRREAVDPTSPERHPEDAYFNAIRALDDKDCISALLCQIARAPSKFKSFGQDVAAYFKRHEFDGSPSVAHYRKAFERGLAGGDCTVPTCKADVLLLGSLLAGMAANT
ncbi:hypothetical protein HPB48_001527 [Haemaphysalis longicornis]|uniref:Secreted protein n=1 Tax=Haemaphysalis longicornis TaxID=44386 RepID=A0A9J6H062_HAELO|nr:hypothetical protein HPB48_001527 [Haemaphysalis longicornis]